MDFFFVKFCLLYLYLGLSRLHEFNDSKLSTLSEK